MATFNSFNAFARDLARGRHDFSATAAADAIHIYLSNAAPSASGDAIKTDLAEIANGNGYTTGGTDTQQTVSWSAATDTAKVVAGVTGISWTATTGGIASFRYVALVNATTGNYLIGWWDYGSQVALSTAGDQFVVAFGASLFTINV